MIRDDFGIDEVQFSWDYIDPWWPEEYRRPMAENQAFCVGTWPPESSVTRLSRTAWRICAGDRRSSSIRMRRRGQPRASKAAAKSAAMASFRSCSAG